MIFIKNKYTRVYYQIIDQAKQKNLPNTYTEKHHIIPKSLNGGDDAENIVKLTAKEHFVCHWLLTKMTTGLNQKKMAYACKRMMTKNSSQQRYKVTGRKYAQLKIKMNSLLKGRVFSEEWKNKLKTSAQNRAKKLSDEERKKRSQIMSEQNKLKKGRKKPWMQGEKNYFHHNKFFGEKNHFYGKSHTKETLKKLKIEKPRICCIHCYQEIGGEGNLVRWHGDNCKHK